jgi:hypothetical protein
VLAAKRGNLAVEIDPFGGKMTSLIQARDKRPESGILILPMSCLLLSIFAGTVPIHRAQ